MGVSSQSLDSERRRDKDFLYSALDLPTYASETEIKERHRALSLVFHPDKQRNESTREYANERFLDIQSAYEILSDPFLREVYDTLGYDGLKLNFPPEFKYLPKDELRCALRQHLYDHRATELSNRYKSKATATCLMDARGIVLPILYPGDVEVEGPRYSLSYLSLRHTFLTRLNPRTKLQLISKLGQPSGEDLQDIQDPNQFSLLRGNIVGVLTRQFSPSQQLEVRTSLIKPSTVTVAWSHEDQLNYARVSVPVPARTLLTNPTSGLLLKNPPPVSVNLRRRLFPNTLTLGVLDLTFARGRQASVNIGLLKPVLALPDNPLSSSSNDKRKSRKSNSSSGPYQYNDNYRDISQYLAVGYATGLVLRLTTGPVLYVQWNALCRALSLTGKLALEYGLLSGIGGTVEGNWSKEDGEAEVGVGVSWNVQGIIARINLDYLGQKLELPVTLSDTVMPRVLIAATLLPASIYVATDYFWLRKQRQVKRKKLRAVYETASEDHLRIKRAEAEAVASMLKDVARKSTQAEGASGLLIREARYFPIDENGLPMEDLGLDVTIPVQALVRDGQVYVPAGRSKSILRGFFDPMPECEKRLGVRYTFRGQEHYVEVGEKTPLLMPLESHRVESRRRQEKIEFEEK